VKAVILAAGYGTRLRPLTDRVAKPLLPLAGRPIVSLLCAKLAEVDEVDAVHVVSNHRFADDFERWAAGEGGRLPVYVHDDGTTNDGERLGAVRDAKLAVDRGELAGEDLLVIAGDNVFDYSLAEYVRFWRAKQDGSAIAVCACDLDMVRRYSMVDVDANDRVVAFVEKPERPTSNLAGTATYVYRREHVPLLEAFLAGDPRGDRPGDFMQWLHARVPVYAYRFSGDWVDIGNPDQLLDADNRMRARAGLPLRDAYSVEL
jgi:glucose-1-phosphate thymidylyltransferase